MKTFSHSTTLAFVIFMAVFYRPSSCSAQVDPWEFEVYPYQTLGRGVLELEWLNGVVAKGHNEAGIGTSSGTLPSRSMWRTALELTYGLSDRIEAAAYLNLAKPNGRDLQYAGSKFRVRGSLFDQGQLPVDLGWYIELDYHRVPQFDDQKLELELRPLIQKDFGSFSVMLNPIFEKVLTGPEKNKGFEFGYATGVYYRWRRSLSPGVEFFGGIGNINDTEPRAEQQHYVFPVVRGELTHGIEYNFGAGFGLTRGSDPVIVKFNLEVEKFIGAIFGPSSGSSWFW
ncbi:MAG TPA: hypothetical protein VNT76_21990 [Candidatus Binatus sp.]|nr:hypothetical protein [Candidatus Binatus sp.]